MPKLPVPHVSNPLYLKERMMALCEASASEALQALRPVVAEINERMRKEGSRLRISVGGDPLPDD